MKNHKQTDYTIEFVDTEGEEVECGVTPTLPEARRLAAVLPDRAVAYRIDKRVEYYDELGCADTLYEHVEDGPARK